MDPSCRPNPEASRLTPTDRTTGRPRIALPAAVAPLRLLRFEADHSATHTDRTEKGAGLDPWGHFIARRLIVPESPDTRVRRGAATADKRE